MPLLAVDRVSKDARALGSARVHRLLDPTLDIVFKLLFTSGPDSEVALRDLLTAVLAPPRPNASRPPSRASLFACSLI